MTPHPFRMSPAGHDMFGACDAFKLKVGGYFEGFCYCGKQHIVRKHVADFAYMVFFFVKGIDLIKSDSE